MLGIAVASDGKHLVTLGIDGTLKFWGRDQTTPRWVAYDAGWNTRLLSFTSANRPIAISADGTKIAAGTSTGIVKVLDVKTGQVRTAFLAHSSSIHWVGFTPDGASVVTSGRVDRVVKVWDANTGHPEVAYRGRRDALSDAAVSPDGRYVIAAGPEGPAQVWDLRTRPDARPLAILGRGKLANQHLIAFDPTGRLLVASSGAECVVFDVVTGQKLRSYKLPQGVFSSIVDVGFDPTGSVRVVTNTRVHTFSTENSLPASREFQPIPSTAGTYGNWEPTPFVAAPARLTATGSVVYRSSGPAAYLIRPEAGQPAVPLAGHGLDLEKNGPAIAAVGVCPNGSRFVTAGRVDHKLRLWDADGKHLRIVEGTYPGVVALGMTPDARRLLVGQTDGPGVVIDVDTGLVLSRFTVPRQRNHEFSFSSDGRRFAVAVNTPEPAGGVVVFDTETGLQLLDIPWDCGVARVTFRPDNQALVAIDVRGVIWSLDAAERTTAERIATAVKWEPHWHAVRAAAAVRNLDSFALEYHLHRLPADFADRSSLRLQLGKELYQRKQAGNLSLEAAGPLNRQYGLSGFQDRFSLAAQYIEAGNVPAYRDLCSHALSLIKPEYTPDTKSRVFRLCLIGPGGVENFGSLIALRG